MKNLTTGVRQEDTKNAGKRDYPKSGQGDGSMTRNASGVSKATGEPNLEFAKAGGMTPVATYPKKGAEGTKSFPDSIAASPINRQPRRTI